MDPAATVPATAPPGVGIRCQFVTAVTSDYNYRGYTLSDHLPSVSGNVEATYNIFFASVKSRRQCKCRISRIFK